MRWVLILIVGAALLGLGLFWYSGGAARVELWALDMQRQTQSVMARALRALRAGEPGALAGLFGVAFTYGFVHAAGPGHGKFLLAGYGAARRTGFARLTGLAVISSLAQAATAVVLVYAGIFLLGWGRDRLAATADGALAVMGNVMILLLGLWLLWRGLRGLWRMHLAQGASGRGAVLARAAPSAAASAKAQTSAVGHRHGHSQPKAHLHSTSDVHAQTLAHQHGHSHHHDPQHGRAQAHTHGEHHPHHQPPSHGSGAAYAPDHAHSDDHHHPADCGCGHAHMPDPEALARAGNWREQLALILGVALRPCTGAVFILILTWQMGIAGAGIMAAFVMGLGTASVTAAVALGAGLIREGALRSLSSSRALAIAVPTIELSAGLLLALVSAGLLLRGY